MILWLCFVSVSIDFPSNSKGDVPFHYIACYYSCANWEDHHHHHLKDFPYEDIFKLELSAAVSEYCEWIQFRIDVYNPHRRYQVKPHSSLWFSALCAAAIAHRNPFLVVATE